MQVICDGDSVRIEGDGLVKWAGSVVESSRKELVALVLANIGLSIEPTEAAIVEYLQCFGLDDLQARGVLSQMVGYVTEGTPLTIEILMRAMVFCARIGLTR